MFSQWPTLFCDNYSGFFEENFNLLGLLSEISKRNVEYFVLEEIKTRNVVSRP